MAQHTHIGRPFLSLVCLALLLGMIGPARAVSADPSVYQDPDGAYSLTLPDNWHLFSSDSQGTDFTDTFNGTTVAIATHPADGVALDDAIQQAATPLAQQPGVRADPGGMIDLTLGGEVAKEASFHNDPETNGVPLWAGAVTAIHQGIVYVIYFLATPDKGSADVGTILASWQFP